MALTSLVLVTRAQVVAAHGSAFERGQYPVYWSKMAPTMEPSAYADPRLDAFAHRLVGSRWTSSFITGIDKALRTQLWYSRGSPAVASTFITLADGQMHNGAVARHVAAELERLYAASFCFRPLWELRDDRCHLEASFVLPSAK